MMLYMRMPTFVNLSIHVIDKEKEDSDNQTTEAATNTNERSISLTSVVFLILRVFRFVD